MWATCGSKRKSRAKLPLTAKRRFPRGGRAAISIANTIIAMSAEGVTAQVIHASKLWPLWHSFFLRQKKLLLIIAFPTKSRGGRAGGDRLLRSSRGVCNPPARLSIPHPKKNMHQNKLTSLHPT